jgi:hypothetical protein
MSDPKHKTEVKTSIKKHTSWSASEEEKFLEAIDRLMRAHLWNEVKSDQEISLRGANGVRSYWEALVS